MRKVFFAHADPKLTSMYEKSLRPHFTFDSAQDGLTAMRKIRLLQPNLIVSDYHLPSLSGLGLLKFVRSEPKLAMIPFIFLTDHDDVGGALSFGANAWLNRLEISPDILIENIYNHLKLNKQAQTYGL